METNLWVYDDPYRDPSPPSSTMHVADLDGASATERNKWQASVSVSVVDADGAPVPDATVTISSFADSGDLWDIEPCVTDGAGLCSLSYSRIGDGILSLTFVVDDVSHATHAYDAGANTDPDGDSDGTSITVNAP